MTTDILEQVRTFVNEDGGRDFGPKTLTKAEMRLERVAKVRSNVIAFWRKSNAAHLAMGMNWYPIVSGQIRALAETHGVTFRAACGVVAALSPEQGWQKNYEGLGLAIECYRAGGRTGADLSPKANKYTKCRDKAMACLCGLDPDWVLDNFGKGSDSYKTLRFFANLMGDLSVVTVDRHHLRICLGAWEGAPCPMPLPNDLKVQGTLYLDCESGTQRFAEEVGIDPASGQSAKWVAWRNGAMF